MKTITLLLSLLFFFFGNFVFADVAITVKPGTNIRKAPDGELLCRLPKIKVIEVLRFNNNWYSTNACGSLGVINKNHVRFSLPKNKLTSLKFDEVGLFYNGAASVKVAGLWGLIDINGKWLAPPKYDDIGRNHEGAIAVKRNQKYAFIDSKGNEITKFFYNGANYFSSGLAGVKIGKKWGYINKKSQLPISARYDLVREFKEGFAPVKLNNKWGYINKKGKWLVQPTYDDAYNFSEGYAVVIVNNKRGFINKRGEFKIKPSYRRVTKFSEGLAAVSTRKDHWYFIDENNRQVFNKSYTGVRSFSENASAVMNSDRKWGYIDKKGNIIIHLQFDRAYDFKSGLALVRNGEKRGFINFNGQVVVPLKYDDAYQFNEGYAPVKRGTKWVYLKKPSLKNSKITDFVSKTTKGFLTKDQSNLSKNQYTNHGNGTITDKQTNLMWKQCSEGSSGINCDKEPTSFKWQAAMDHVKGISFAGYSDWRLPTKEELDTLVFCSKGRVSKMIRIHNGNRQVVYSGKCKGKEYAKPTIIKEIFPNTPDIWYWTSSEFKNSDSGAWGINFSNGKSLMNYKNLSNNMVRLVRPVE